MIKSIKKQNKILEIKESDQNHNGEHLMTEEFQNKIGVNIQENLKRETQLFGESMKKNSGKTIMQE